MRSDTTRMAAQDMTELSSGARKVLFLASAIVFYETIYFTVLVPLLPYYETEFDLTKTAVGLLTATYAAGALCGAFPGGLLALRLGTRAALLVGLTLLVLGSVVFGLADSYLVLTSARFFQGIGSSVAWIGALTWLVAVAPQARRGEVIGIALGAAVGGSLFGPAVGAIATHVGTDVTFALTAALGLALGGLVLSTPPAALLDERLSSMRHVLRSRPATAGVVLLLLGALLIGSLSVLAPLQLDGFGWSASEIAAVFLVSSVLTMVATPPIGRWSDKRGRTPPIVVGLIASLVTSFGLAAAGRSWIFAFFVIAAGVAYSSIWVPGTALLSDGMEQAGLGLAVGFVLFNLAWTPGFLAGSAAGGWLAESTEDSIAYGLLAMSCAAALVGTIVFGRRRAPSP